jgi:hypothetical protein
MRMLSVTSQLAHHCRVVIHLFPLPAHPLLTGPTLCWNADTDCPPARGVQEMRQHVQVEEEVLLPALKASPGMTPHHLFDLGERFATADTIAPTRWLPRR